MNFFQRIFSLPHFEDNPEKTRRAIFLHYTSFSTASILALLIFANIVFNHFKISVPTLILFILLLVQITVYGLNRARYVYAASSLLLSVGWLGLTSIAFAAEGIRDVAIIGYFVIIIGAGFLFGWRAASLFTVASIGIIWLLAVLQSDRILQPAFEQPTRVALDLSMVFILILLETYFLAHTLTKSLEQTKHEYSDRLRAEEELLEERERLALALAAAKMETWDWDIETGAVSWSEGIEAMFGMSKGQFDRTYDTYMSLIHPDDLPMLQQSVGKALADENYDYIVVHRLIWRSGDVRWLEGRGKVYRNETGKPIRMTGTVVDVTERKNAEIERERLIRELAQKNTELEQFTYTVSHDLKAPIITVKGFLGFLGDDVKSGNRERVERDVIRINEAVDRMHRLLNELLELSRIGRMMNPPEPVSVRDLVEEAMALLAGRLQSTSARVEIVSDLPVVQGDKRRLLEVMQNLMDNAAKFSAARTSPLIEIGAGGIENGMPILFVRDNGIGISPEHYERIFGLFNKLDPMVDGTGVGLAIVKRIIEFHGGRIWVESDAETGSTFYFTLPIIQTKIG